MTERCLLGDDEWCQTFRDIGSKCCVRCRTHHKNIESCPGITEDGQEAPYTH